MQKYNEYGPVDFVFVGYKEIPRLFLHVYVF